MADTDEKPVVRVGNGEQIVRIGLLGCGNVGQAFVDMVEESADLIAAQTGQRLKVCQIAVHDMDKVRESTLISARLTNDANSVVLDEGIDLVVECMGGIEPARSLITAALAAGKPVVTANKELIANYGAEIRAASEAGGAEVAFEAAVGGAIPVLGTIGVSLAGENIKRVTGILNGTTNYILSAMSSDQVGYDQALAEAQRLGFAERDPSADVKGHDAAAKVAILASLAFHTEVVATDVYREGIENIGSGEIDFARRLGYVVKLLAVAERVPHAVGGQDQIAVRVHPAMVPSSHPLATVRGSFNAVFIEGQSSGELMLYGKGAGGRPTASAVLGDVLALAARRHIPGHLRNSKPPLSKLAICPIDDLVTQYYVSIDVWDQPGALAEVATVFGEQAVSIRSMEQVGLGDEARLVFITHVAREADVQTTLTKLNALNAVKRIGGLMRVIGPEH